MSQKTFFIVGVKALNQWLQDRENNVTHIIERTSQKKHRTANAADRALKKLLKENAAKWYRACVYEVYLDTDKNIFMARNTYDTFPEFKPVVIYGLSRV